MFACPSCGTELNRTAGKRGVVWLCVKCKGRAMNVSLLRQLVERTQFNRMWQMAWKAPQLSERLCPSCQRLMVETPVNPPPDPLVLDVCKPCQFVWFDPSEFEKMPAAPPPAAPPELPPEARKALALQKVRQIAEASRRESTGSWNNASPDGFLAMIEGMFASGSDLWPARRFDR